MIAQDPYAGGLVVGAATPAAPAPAPTMQLRRPTRDQLTYTRELLTVILLLAAFPWLLGKLLTNPGSVLRSGAVAKAV